MSVPLSIIVSQSLCAGIISDKFHIAENISLYKKQDEKNIFKNYHIFLIIFWV